MHFTVVQPAVAKAGIQEGMQVDKKDMDSILGEYTTNVMQGLTDDIIVFTDEIIERTERLVEKMYDVNIKLYPDFRIVRMKKLNKSSNNDAAVGAPS